MSRKEISPEHHLFLSKIGDSLKQLRQKKNVSILQMSKDLKMSRNIIPLLEQGKVYINISTFLTILDYYDIVPEIFFRDL